MTVDTCDLVTLVAALLGAADMANPTNPRAPSGWARPPQHYVGQAVELIGVARASQGKTPSEQVERAQASLAEVMDNYHRRLARSHF